MVQFRKIKNTVKNENYLNARLDNFIFQCYFKNIQIFIIQVREGKFLRCEANRTCLSFDF